jgi:Heterokaryon incompatibility protein (HET)
MDPYQYFALHPRHLDNPDGTSIAAGHSRIRIIRLLPGHRDAELHCVIEHIELRDVENEQKVRHLDNGGVPFDALSYAWGDAAVSPELLVCEETVGVIDKSWPCNCDIPRGKGLLRITTNLAQALRALRDRKYPRNLWVDAVCIDQSYDPEKLQQIQIMGRLYSQASVVRVWLGLEGDAKLAFDYIHRWAKPFSLPNKELVMELMLDKLDPVHVALRQLFSRSYFQRRWVIQEVALASEVICLCGDLELPWDTLTHAASALNFDEAVRDNEEIPLVFGDVEHALLTIPRLRDLRRDVASRLRNPVEGMMVFRLSRCRDDRDRVLALLGYFSHLWTSPEQILPQLTDAGSATNSLRFAYTIPARWQLKFQLDHLSDTETRSTPAVLDLFSIACVTRSFSSERVDPHLPSWVPDWRLTEFEYDRYVWSTRLGARYGASARLYSNDERRVKWPVIKDPDLQGHLNTPVQLIDYVDTVILLKPPSSREEPPNNSGFHSIASFKTVCSFLGKKAYHSDQVCRPCSIFRIPVQRRTMSIDLVNVLTAHLYGLHAVFQGSNIPVDQPRQILNYLHNPWPESDALDRRQKLIARFLRGRCIFVTREGYAGIGNLRVRHRDRLVSVSGGEPDFVLRFNGQSCPETGHQVAELISDTCSPKIVDADYPRTMVCLT